MRQPQGLPPKQAFVSTHRLSHRGWRRGSQSQPGRNSAGCWKELAGGEAWKSTAALHSLGSPQYSIGTYMLVSHIQKYVCPMFMRFSLTQLGEEISELEKQKITQNFWKIGGEVLSVSVRK